MSTPPWYLTTSEFAELVVDSLEANGYFKKSDRVHPEDILSAFETTANAIAAGIAFAGKRASKVQ